MRKKEKEPMGEQAAPIKEPIRGRGNSPPLMSAIKGQHVSVNFWTSTGLCTLCFIQASVWERECVEFEGVFTFSLVADTECVEWGGV